MTTEADIGLETRLEMRTNDNWHLIAEVVKFTPPSDEDEEVEATHLQSTAREYIAGIPEFGEVEFTINFVPGSDTETMILAAKAGRQPVPWRIVWKNGWEWAYNALVRGYAPGEITPDGKMEASVKTRVTGSVIRAPGDS